MRFIVGHPPEQMLPGVVAVPRGPATVSCATVIAPGLAGCVLSMRYSAPLVEARAPVALQELKAMPFEPSCPPAPLLKPMVSHESKAALGSNLANWGSTPPMLAPNGAGFWKAGGMCSGNNGRAALPKILYRFRALLVRVTLSVYVV